MKNFLSVILIGFILFGNSYLYAIGNVTPDVNEIIPTGGSFVVNKEVVTPEIPPKLDIVLDVDISGSYGDDIANIKALDDGIYDDIAASGTDFNVGLVSFSDFPISPFGNAGDFPFVLNQDLTPTKLTWTTAVNGLSILFGGDGPESQYNSLKEAAENITWRPGSKRVIILTTDADFHVPTDGGGTYPGPSEADTIAALVAEGIVVIALKAPGAGAQMDAIALATGGSVLPTTSSSSDIATAILAGLGNLPITVIPDVSACSPLAITFSPVTQTVTSGDTATFVETIEVPNNPALQGTNVSCEVVFNDENGNEIGRESINVDIPDTTAPVVKCVPTVNPAGKNIPKAGEKSKGQNEDGFYQLISTDNLDKTPEIYVNGFGPFSSGDKVKITEAPGIIPSEKKIGNLTDAVISHLLLNTDALVTAVDDSGNKSVVSCLVPPMPK